VAAENYPSEPSDALTVRTYQLKGELAMGYAYPPFFPRLHPDRAKPIFTEKNVKVAVPGTDYCMDAAYDLDLYEELGVPTRAVLEVTMILILDFEDTGDTPELKWKNDNEKASFMDDFQNACEALWSEKFRLVTSNPVPPAKSAGVIIDIDAYFREDAPDHSHWNVKVEKVSSFKMSRTDPGGGGRITNGKSHWDSLDMTPNAPQRSTISATQRSALHEFGHMLGYRDEYSDPGATPKEKALLFNPSHPVDKDSIMYWSEVIYPRHYVFFADWISQQWMKRDRKNCKADDWKVDGNIPVGMWNAGL
jgi:hypothetical protein